METTIDATRLATITRLIRHSGLSPKQWAITDSTEHPYEIAVQKGLDTKSIDGNKAIGTKVRMLGIVLEVYGDNARHKDKQELFDGYMSNYCPDVERHVEETTYHGLGRIYYYVI